MPVYQHRPLFIKAVQWFPGSETPGVTEQDVQTQQGLLKAYLGDPASGQVIPVHPGWFITTNSEGVQGCVEEFEFRANWRLIDVQTQGVDSATADNPDDLRGQPLNSDAGNLGEHPGNPEQDRGEVCAPV